MPQDTSESTTIDTQYLGRNVEDAAEGYVLTYVGSPYAEWQPPSGGGAGGLVQTASVSLTAADVLDLNSTPVEIVAAPGAGKAISVMKAAGISTFVSQRYAHDPNGSNTLMRLRWGSSSDTDEAWVDLYGAIHSAFSAMSDNVNATFLSSEDISGYDNQALSLVSSQSLGFGPIATSSLNDGGTGYAPGDTGTVDGAGSADATYVVDTVDGGGAILTYHLDAAGAAYAPAAGVTASATSGGGSGFALDIATVVPGDGTLKITVYYVVLDLS